MIRLSSVLAIPALAGALLASAPAHPAAASAGSGCSIEPYGGIGDYWRNFGGADGVFGCPKGAEYTVSNSTARRQNFAGGQIAWTPDQGHSMIIAAYHKGETAYFRWGPTNPFHYDYFKVAVRSSHIANGVFTYKNGPRTRGAVSYYGPGRYTFRVRGCTDRLIGDICRRDWTVSVTTDF
ncbi:LGFP repeat-containing protein [Nonomuraea basaltis]|uniref:LGFP repeat-containing protein n=1 Tax=Nonomuraea basaltis TaxID=2495887 RepID=UPI00110C5980|nr:hypothetical protein [Nonomuraea basaltis]TMR90880.1 hypothetical protein EJK15_52890 [Nonomuraea basaltis]